MFYYIVTESFLISLHAVVMDAAQYIFPYLRRSLWIPLVSVLCDPALCTLWPCGQVHRSLVWVAGEQDRGVCTVKGKSEESCQNYIKANLSLSSKYFLTPEENFSCGGNFSRLLFV
jgi:hypothetical protein